MQKFPPSKLSTTWVFCKLTLAASRSVLMGPQGSLVTDGVHCPVLCYCRCALVSCRSNLNTRLFPVVYPLYHDFWFHDTVGIRNHELQVYEALLKAKWMAPAYSQRLHRVREVQIYHVKVQVQLPERLKTKGGRVATNADVIWDRLDRLEVSGVAAILVQKVRIWLSLSKIMISLEASVNWCLGQYDNSVEEVSGLDCKLLSLRCLAL